MNYRKLIQLFWSIIMCTGLLLTGCGNDDDDNNPTGFGTFTYGGNSYEFQAGALTYQGITNSKHTFDLALFSNNNTFVAFRIYTTGSAFTSGVYRSGTGVGNFTAGSYVQINGVKNNLVSGAVIATAGDVYIFSINCKDSGDNEFSASYTGELSYKDNAGGDPGPGEEPVPGDPVKDVDGNTYKTVIIGSATWMAENLKTTKYNDGSNIPKATGNNTDLSNPCYSWYNNDEKNKAAYGALYNYYVVNTGKLCPEGWHVPDDDEWDALVNAAGGIFTGADKLKEKGDTHWQSSSNSNATNETGFTALPGGAWEDYFGYNGLGTTGTWWTTTLSNEAIRIRIMGYNNPSVSDAVSSQDSRYSVRCVKDK